MDTEQGEDVKVGKKRKRENSEDKWEEERYSSSEMIGKGNPAKWYDVDVVNVGQKKCEKFNCSQTFSKVKVKLGNVESTSEAFRALHGAFKEMLDKTLWGASGDERLKLKQLDKENRIRSRVTIEHPKLDIPVQLPFLPGREITAERLLQEIRKIETSKKDFCLQGELLMTVFRAVLPQGGKKRKDATNVNVQNAIRRLRRFIEIPNTDDLCFGRALVVAKAKAEETQRHRESTQSHFTRLQM